MISCIDSDAPVVPALGVHGALLLLFALSCLALRGAARRGAV
jgi:hypothetical protein